MHFFYGGSSGEGTDYGVKFVGFKIGGLYQTVSPATYHWDYAGQSTMNATIENISSTSGVGALIYQYEEEDEYGNWKAVGDEMTRTVSWGVDCSVENNGEIDFY